jgi:hypothetical protein
VKQYITKHLTTKYGLKKQQKSKETCSVVDLYKLLRHYWCEDKESTCHGRYIVQTAFLMQLIAYTSSRPGALIEQNYYKGLKEVLKYKVHSIIKLQY